MNILITGDIQSKKNWSGLNNNGNGYARYDDYKAAFEATCEALGAAAVQAGHQIILSITNWEQLSSGCDVATYTVIGINSVENKDHRVVFYIPQEPEPPDTTSDIIDRLDELDKLPNITIEKRILGGGYQGLYKPSYVEESDVLILVGGDEKTARTAYTALTFSTSVIPISAFGGAAQHILQQNVANDLDAYRSRCNLTADELASIQSTWTSDPAENKRDSDLVINLITKWVNFQKQVTVAVKRAIVVTVILLIVTMIFWVFLWVMGSEILRQESSSFIDTIIFFALLFLASIVGTGLRTLLSYINNTTAINNVRFLIDVAMGMGIALGLALLYFIGGISYTGEVVVLRSDISNASEAFQRFASIAVTMSLLGLTAGLLLPAEQLKQRLESHIS